MTGWPQAVVRCGPIARARMSEVPPAAKGTMMRIGLFGYCWPRAGRASRLAARAAGRAAATRFMAVLRGPSKAQGGLYTALFSRPGDITVQKRGVMIDRRTFLLPPAAAALAPR